MGKLNKLVEDVKELGNNMFTSIPTLSEWPSLLDGISRVMYSQSGEVEDEVIIFSDDHILKEISNLVRSINATYEGSDSRRLLEDNPCSGLIYDLVFRRGKTVLYVVAKPGIVGALFVPNRSGIKVEECLYLSYN